MADVYWNCLMIDVNSYGKANSPAILKTYRRYIPGKRALENISTYVKLIELHCSGMNMINRDLPVLHEMVSAIFVENTRTSCTRFASTATIPSRIFLSTGNCIQISFRMLKPFTCLADF